MSLTRRDFESIATALRLRLPPAGPDQRGYYLAIVGIAAGLAQTNPRFDRNRFVAACYIDPRDNPEDPRSPLYQERMRQMPLGSMRI